MSFSQIIDHEDTLTLLRHYINEQKVPHAVLFHGTAGIGKSLIAREFAKAINCDRQNDDACDECTNCLKSQNNYHPDLFIIKPESKSGMIMIEQIRDMQNRLQLKPFEGRKKVCIIEDAHAMNESSANALLKTLEEPPETSHIFLVSDKPHNLLQTILSRCHKIHCRPIAATVIEKFLTTDMGLDTQEAESIAVFSDGSLGKARAMAMSTGIYGATGLIVELLLENTNKSSLFVLEKISELKEFIGGLLGDLEQEIIENTNMDDTVGMTAREKKAVQKEMQTQAKIKAAALLGEEMQKLLHFCAFVVRDVYMVQHGRAEHIANKAFREQIELAAQTMTPEDITNSIKTIEQIRRNMVFNMSTMDAIELLFLKIATRPA